MTSPTPTALQASHDAAELAAALPPLLLAAHRAAALAQQGAHGRRRTGLGESFWQFRRYNPGDDAARIDWRQSARSPHLFVREREWETAQTLLLWVDNSASMEWRSDEKLPTKGWRAMLAALAIAEAALGAGEQVALLSAPGRRWHGAQALPQIALALLQADSDSCPVPGDVPRHAAILVISDFLSAIEPWRACFAVWAARGCRGQAVQILDPAEINPPWRGRILFEGCENEAPLLAPKFENWVAAYRERLTARQARLKQLARAVGWDAVLHNTGLPPQHAVQQLYELMAAQKMARVRYA